MKYRFGGLLDLSHSVLRFWLVLTSTAVTTEVLQSSAMGDSATALCAFPATMISLLKYSYCVITIMPAFQSINPEVFFFFFLSCQRNGTTQKWLEGKGKTGKRMN